MVGIKPSIMAIRFSDTDVSNLLGVELLYSWFLGYSLTISLASIHLNFPPWITREQHWIPLLSSLRKFPYESHWCFCSHPVTKSRKSAIWIDTEYVDTDIPDTYYAPNMTAIMVSVHRLRLCIEQGPEFSFKMESSHRHTSEWGYIIPSTRRPVIQRNEDFRLPGLPNDTTFSGLNKQFVTR